MKKIKFQDKEYLLIGDLKGAAIATRFQYENGKESYAHLFSSGDIMRHHKVIGNVKDIETITEPEPTNHAFFNVLFHGFTDR